MAWEDGLGLWAEPLAQLYGLGVRLRRVAYDRRWLAVAAPPVNTISVGGLEAGGSGKTPVTGLLLRALLRAGKHPGLLTRGYGRATRDLVVRRPGTPADPMQLGDEPAMLVQAGVDVAVAACARRVIGAAALAELGCDVLVMDDGFVHRALGRHLDIVVLRAERPVGNGRLLPAGSLREPMSSLRRAHVIWLHARSGAVDVEVPELVRQYGPGALLVRSRARLGVAVERRGGRVDLASAPLLAAAGIARPREFADALRRAGAEVRELVAFPDHHRYDDRDARDLVQRALRVGARAVVVTPKDAVKMARFWPDDADLWVVGTDVEILAGGEAIARRLDVEAGQLFAQSQATLPGGRR
ncbi:MAG: tetraacyldisaccharide 4'-kinase [Myxococcota bacterium]